MSAQLVIHGGSWFLVDCGEGTQIQMRRYHLNFNRISKIFISHLHADHFLGLPGLLSTMSLTGRQKELDIYAPPDLQDFLRHFERIAGSGLKFPVHFHSVTPDGKQLLTETEHLHVWAFPLCHKLPTTGFLFQEKERPRKIRKDFLERFAPGLEDIQHIKSGHDYVDPQGQVHRYLDITEAPPPPRSFAYCSDTGPCPSLPQFLCQPSLLYHEATFANMHEGRARETIHATAADAARAALACGARRLLLGHFSVRYPSPQVILDEARAIFPHVMLAQDGIKYAVE